MTDLQILQYLEKALRHALDQDSARRLKAEPPARIGVLRIVLRTSLERLETHLHERQPPTDYQLSRVYERPDSYVPNE